MKRISKDLKIVKKLLTLTSFLKNQYFDGTETEAESFKHMLRGTCKKNYYFLHSINFLSSDYKNGDAAIDLSRSMFESLIAITFVQEFNPQKKAMQFFKYTPVELWDDTEYAQKIGIQIPDADFQKRQNEFNQVKNSFLRPDPKNEADKVAKKILDISEGLGVSISSDMRGIIIDKYLKEKFGDKVIEPDINRSWAGIALEGMILELEKKGIIPASLKITFEKAYSIGNRKNHLSPVDIETMLDNPKRHRFHQRENMKIGVYMAAFSHIKLCLELSKELKNDSLKLNLEKLEKQLLGRK